MTTESTQSNAGNGADRPRAQTNTERVRKHRAKKREAATLQEALQRVEAERNAALKAEAEREAMLQAALQRAEQAEREVAERLKADVTEAVTSGEGDGGNVHAPVKQPDAPMVGKPTGVPAVSTPVEWRIVERPPVWHPTVIWHPAQRPAAPDTKPPARRSLASITPSAAVAYLVAYSLFLIGLAINVTFAISWGAQATWWGAILMAIEGAAIEVLSLLSPSWGCQLWRGRSYVAAVAAWCIWPGMIVMSLMASTGFSASTIGDVLAQRSRAVFTATGIQDTVQRLADLRKTITEARAAAAIEAQLEIDRPMVARDVWKATKECHDVTIADSAKACAAIMDDRKALAIAQNRDFLDAQLLAAKGALNGASTITSVDPGAESFSKLLGWITRGGITPTPDDIALVRLLGLTIVPSLAGLVLMFAQLLAPPRTKHD
jgi:hypothetical protein